MDIPVKRNQKGTNGLENDGPQSAPARYTTSEITLPRSPPASPRSRDSFQYPLNSRGGSLHAQATISEDDDADSLHTEFWPDPDSDNSDDDINRHSVKRASVRTDGLTKRVGLRHFVQRVGKKSANKKYLMPLDEEERERCDLQHAISSEVHGGKLYLAPIRHPKRVLDVGTGTGKWAIEIATENPESEVVGIDLKPETSNPTPPNCQIIKADIWEEWTFGTDFDLIYARALGDFTIKPEFFQLVYDNLAPGGWAEFQEWVDGFQSANHSLDNTAMGKWDRTVKEGIRRIKEGRSPFINQYKHNLEAIGFTSVLERKYSVPANSWCKERLWFRIGGMMEANILSALEALSAAVLIRTLGWSKEDVDSLLADVRTDLRNPDIHVFATLMTVYCQKPKRGTIPKDLRRDSGMYIAEFDNKV